MVREAREEGEGIKRSLHIYKKAPIAYRGFFIYAVVGVYFYQTLAVIRHGHQQPD